MKNFKIFLILFLLLFFFVTMSAQHTRKDGAPDRRYKENKSSSAKSTHRPSSATRTPKSSTKTSATSKSTKAGKSYSKSTPPKSSTAKRSTKATNPNIKREKNGKIARSESAKREFMKKSGYPKGRKGYVVDHIVPLKKGGCDCPKNMQWQTVEEAKKKDKVENP